MGRSVSYASGSVAKVYYDVSHFGQVEDEEGNLTDEYCQYIGRWDWDDFIGQLKQDLQKFWPSLRECDKSLGDEDTAILENDLCYFGVSEYCGLACLWLVPKESGGCYSDDIKRDNLARGWCSKITPKFLAKFGDLNKIGSFSTGEGIYKRKVI